MPPKKSFKKGNIKKRLVENFSSSVSESVSEGVRRAQNLLTPLLPHRQTLPSLNYEELEAKRHQRQRERYQRLANMEKSKKGSVADESSSVHNSIGRLLKGTTRSLPRLEPLSESTPKFSNRKEKGKRVKKARSNMLHLDRSKSAPVFINNRGAAASAASEFVRSNSGSSLSSLSNENNYSNGSQSNGSHSNVSQERGLLGSLNLLDVPVVVNVPKSKKHRNINNARRMNKYYRNHYNSESNENNA